MDHNYLETCLSFYKTLFSILYYKYENERYYYMILIVALLYILIIINPLVRIIRLINKEKELKNSKTIIPNNIEPHESYIIKLNSNYFIDYLDKDDRKLFNKYIIKAMQMTIKNLHIKYLCNTSYTHTDEIILIFSKRCEKCDAKIYSHMYNGNYNKIISLVTGYANYNFITNLKKVLEDENNTNKEFNIITNNYLFLQFDGHILKYNDYEENEINEYITHNSIIVAQNKSINNYIYGKDKKENLETKINILKNNNIDWNLLPVPEKYGVYCKKINDIIDNSELELKSFKLENSEKNLKLLLDYSWNGDEKLNSEFAKL